MMPILPMLCNHFPRSRPRMATSVMPAITAPVKSRVARSEEHTSELQSRSDLVCRLLLEKKKKKRIGVHKRATTHFSPGTTRIATQRADRQQLNCTARTTRAQRPHPTLAQTHDRAIRRDA